MDVVRTVEELRNRLKQEANVACVPTMGNIHDGHLRLVRLAYQHAPCVVTTIFVNRLQFAHGEDFEKYPRTFAEDCAEAGSSWGSGCVPPGRVTDVPGAADIHGRPAPGRQ